MEYTGIRTYSTQGDGYGCMTVTLSVIEVCEELSATTAERERAHDPDLKDVTAASLHFDQLKLNGLKAPITTEKLNTFIRAYKMAKRAIDPDSQPKPTAEAQMLISFAMKDSAIREIFELKAAVRGDNEAFQPSCS